MWVGVAADGRGCLYVTDALEASIKRFDAAGKLLGRADWARSGGSGFGVRRYPVDVLDGNVYVAVPDPFRSSVKVFDAGLNLRGSVGLPDPADDLQALPGGRLAYSCVSLSADRAGTVRVVDLSGRLRASFSCRGENDAPALSMIDFRIDGCGELYAAFNYLDKVLKLDRRGRLLWARSLLGVVNVKTRKILFRTVPETPTFKDMALDAKGRLFILGGGYSKNRSRDVYVLDSDGRLLGTLTLPHPSHCVVVDRSGFLYARADQGMTLKKYRILEPVVPDARR
jgi:hypothetical protein